MPATLNCPIRGPLKISAYTKDGLRYSEEKRRIDCINFLLAKGYPASHFKVETTLFRFGNKGRNSFRTDFCVLDAPLSSLPDDIEKLKPHIKLVAEIKRDNADAVVAKKTQVYPALDFLHDLAAVGIYWDDLEQRLFYRTVSGTQTKTHETSAALLPKWGKGISSPKLVAKDLRALNLQQLFIRIEDRLHPEVSDKAERFEIMLQLLITKLFDEHIHTTPTAELDLQDFTDAPLSDSDVKALLEKILTKAVGYYGKYLPKKVPTKFDISGAMLRSISALLAPAKILGTKREIVQEFYMYFAQGVYRWEMAQYFTPTEVVDFIVTLTNPHGGDQIRDPACGSGDFLISAMHSTAARGADLRDSIWGSDNSRNAVQVAVLNMVLNGDGKSNIKQEDSLATVEQHEDSFSVMLCNPPFGVRIQEKKFEVLKLFDLGHEWAKVDGRMEMQAGVAKSQETGLLFAELCVRQAQRGHGRVGIILPNGYLGNRGPRYVAFREWLLRHARLVAVVGFPRFTFKKSGADVSASVVVLERRKKPLAAANEDGGYNFYAGLVEAVGWSVGDNRAERVFKRDPESGTLVVDPANDPIIDADFDRVLGEFHRSDAAADFPWIVEGITVDPKGPTHSVSIDDVLARGDLSIDPKRWCARLEGTRKKILKVPHFKLSEVVAVVPETSTSIDPSAAYRYVEIQDVADGGVMPTSMRGWELPDRARHEADEGDLYIGRIWSSVSKWCLIGGNTTGMRVSNGFHRLKVKPGKEDFLVDLVAGFSTEAYRIQARAFCTGSDGLADLPDDDVLEIILPRITDPDARKVLKKRVDDLLAGRSTIASVVNGLITDGRITAPTAPPRSSHVVQV